jgi:hypothetical protein
LRGANVKTTAQLFGGVRPPHRTWTIQGLSRFQARGHPRAGERQKPTGIPSDPYSPEELALKLMKRGDSLKSAAKAHKISQERLRRYLRENTQTTRIGRRWQIFDLRRFHFPIYSRGRIVELWLSADEASKAGHYMAAVGRFLPTGDASVLRPFVGQGVRDIKGTFYPFETNENTLYRLDQTGELSVPEIYKIQA